jgi:hypothetical protein
MYLQGQQLATDDADLVVVPDSSGVDSVSSVKLSVPEGGSLDPITQGDADQPYAGLGFSPLAGPAGLQGADPRKTFELQVDDAGNLTDQQGRGAFDPDKLEDVLIVLTYHTAD